MRTNDKYVRDLLESMGFVFQEHNRPGWWVCPDIGQDQHYGPRRCFKHGLYEMTVEDVNSREGRWHYERYKMGVRDLEGHTNSYREALLLLFSNVKEVASKTSRYEIAQEMGV